jgi:tetratricopeptide (TPR) repeat protein
MAEAVVAMSAEEPDHATERLQPLLMLAGEIRDKGLIAISNFWIARNLRRKGRYDDALQYSLAARSLAHELGYDKMVAVIQVLEVWLYFQKGKQAEALAMLREASAALGDSDDYISRGNVESAFGRIARRSGRYQQALLHFDRSLAEYKQRDPRHPHLARTLVNAAFVRRLMALQLHKKLDEEASRRSKSVKSAPGATFSDTRAHVDQIRLEAHDDLVKAGEIYREHGIYAGLGNVRVNLGHLFLDRGDLDLAAAEAMKAFELGEQKADLILQARARILQSMVENEKYEEQLDEGQGLERHAQFAHDLATDAVDYSEQTQNRRLIARAFVWQGLTLCNDLLFDAAGRDRARVCHDRAAELLRPEPQDYIWADLQTLKRKCFRTEPVNTTLLEWSQGMVGDKSFQQIAEEFAELIIPKVWEREGKKVSRVAKRLAISPKKVRRVLASRGLHVD